MKGCSRIESQYRVKEEQEVARDQNKSKRLVSIGNYENQNFRSADLVAGKQRGH